MYLALVPIRQVLSLAWILSNVKEHRSAAVQDELEVPISDRHLRTALPDPPEERSWDGGALLEREKNILSIAGRSLRSRRAGRGKNRFVQIHRDSDLTGHGAGRDVARPPNEGRHSNPAFPHGTLATEQPSRLR
jgi:hypothetical protein